VNYRLAADALLVFHGLFIVFAVLGGLAVLWRCWMLWIHLACAAWAAMVVSMGWICPLTPLEQRYRLLAGQQGYSGGFIEHYLMAAIYPDGLTRGVQVALGLGVMVVNVLIYAWVWRLVSKRGQ
jgi:Protein of Unknown function (DUF2784)